MKKFLSIVLLTFAIFIPLTVTVEAADIPDIRSLNESQLTLPTWRDS